MLKLLTEFLWCFHNYWFCFKAAVGESWVRQRDGKPEGSDWPRSRGTPVAELKGSTLIYYVALNFLQPLSPRISTCDLLPLVLLGNKPHSQDNCKM